MRSEKKEPLCLNETVLDPAVKHFPHFSPIIELKFVVKLKNPTTEMLWIKSFMASGIAHTADTFKIGDNGFTIQVYTATNVCSLMFAWACKHESTCTRRNNKVSVAQPGVRVVTNSFIWVGQQKDKQRN